MDRDFNYSKAEADLYDCGCPYPEGVYEDPSILEEYGLSRSKYERHDNHDSHNQSSGSEGCFLTTACVDVKGLPDDCDELQTLRSYRDIYLKNRKNGWEDINLYYDVAPRIVRNINKLPDAKHIWEEMYDSLVIPCVEMIKNGKNEEAYKLYKNTVEDLLGKYGDK